MIWAGHVARMGEWLEKLKGRDNLKDPGVVEKMILELILWKYSENLWFGFIWLSIWSSSGLLPTG
jgi:hypothetical protein